MSASKKTFCESGDVSAWLLWAHQSEHDVSMHIIDVANDPDVVCVEAECDGESAIICFSIGKGVIVKSGVTIRGDRKED